MKLNVLEYAAKVKSDDDYDKIRNQLKAKCVIEIKGAQKPDVNLEPVVGSVKTDAKPEHGKKAEAKS
jgi:hypothetical protein